MTPFQDMFIFTNFLLVTFRFWSSLGHLVVPSNIKLSYLPQDRIRGWWETEDKGGENATLVVRLVLEH